jgi:hypothetical protein
MCHDITTKKTVDTKNTPPKYLGDTLAYGKTIVAKMNNYKGHISKPAVKASSMCGM